MSLFFRPLKDNAIWRRALSVALGFALVVWGLVAIYKGHITYLGKVSSNVTVFVARSPIVFWIVVVLGLYLGVACVYRGIRGKKDDDA